MSRQFCEKDGIEREVYLQYTEEDILSNNDPSAAFQDFLSVLGDTVRLKGFDRYKGGGIYIYEL